MNPQVTKDWATWQNTIFAGATPDGAGLTKWNTAGYAQELICPTNLSLRQRIIRGDLEEAQRQFDALRRNGYGVEGWGYMLYCLPAILWAVGKRWGAADEMLMDFGAIQANYSRLAFPNPEGGNLPLAEVSADVRLPFDPLTAEDDIEDATYRVHRLFNADHSECIAQILICLDTNPEPRANFHHHLDAGYFCLWLKGVGYVNRVAPYTGFDDVRGAESAGVASVLPAGALLPAWRAVPPKVRMAYNAPSHYYFQWGENIGPGASRDITWDARRVTVIDNGAVRWWEIPQE